MPEPKLKYYNLGTFKVTARIAKQEHQCNCCLKAIIADVEYREVQRLPSRSVYGGPSMRLHVECFRSLTRNIRNCIEMLAVSNTAPMVFDECPKPHSGGNAVSGGMDKLDPNRGCAITGGLEEVKSDTKTEGDTDNRG